MSFAFMLSYVVLWILVILITVRVIYSRTPGVIRVGRPSLPQQDHGVPIGEPFPLRRVHIIDGREYDLDHGSASGTVAVFTTPGCSACHSLYPDLATYAKEHPELGFLVIMVGTEETVREQIGRTDVTVPVMALPIEELETVQTKIFPFAYFLSREGRVLAKGVTNAKEHLDALINLAENRGVPLSNVEPKASA